MSTAPTPDVAVEIARIERILNSGVAETTVDGVTTKYDLASLRQRLRELKAIQSPDQRPRFATINLANGGT